MFYYVMLFFNSYCDHRHLHVLTHSFPTLRSSYLFMRMSSAVPAPLSDESRARGSRKLLVELWHFVRTGGPDSGDASHPGRGEALDRRSEEHTYELQSLMRTSYAVLCLK